MAQHIRILATAMILLGIGGGLVSLIWMIASGGPLGLASQFESASSVLGPIMVGVAFLNIILAAPLFVTGRGLLRLQGWARTLAMVICALEVICIPFGPILGTYGFWVLTSLEVEPLFEERGGR